MRRRQRVGGRRDRDARPLGAAQGLADRISPLDQQQETVGELFGPRRAEPLGHPDEAPAHLALVGLGDAMPEPFTRARKMRFSRITEFNPVQHQPALKGWFAKP
jgi:hypothetical protein